MLATQYIKLLEEPIAAMQATEYNYNLGLQYFIREIPKYFILTTDNARRTTDTDRFRSNEFKEIIWRIYFNIY